MKIKLKPAPRLRKIEEEVFFKNLSVRGRSTGGNIITKNAVRNVVRMTKAAREEVG